MKKPFFPPQLITLLSRDKKKRILFSLTFYDRIFLSLEEADSSIIGTITSSLMIVIIFISCLTFILATDPSIKYQPETCDYPACRNDPILCPDQIICPSVPPAWLSHIEAVCVYLFTIDYILRICLAPFVPARICGVLNAVEWDTLHPDESTPDPNYSILTQFFLYLILPMNLVDIVAILPLYISLASASSSSFSIIRLLRLIRITRIIKVMREREDFAVLGATVRSSLPVLSMLLYYVLLGVVVVAAIIFQFEQGQFRVTEEYPDGAYLRPTVDMQGWSVSPFTSIWVSLYWSIVTATTLGYGDIYPTTPAGRIIACLWIFCGILIVAMPISIIGSNFQLEYQLQLEKDKEIQRLNAFHKSHSTAYQLSSLIPNKKKYFFFPSMKDLSRYSQLFPEIIEQDMGSDMQAVELPQIEESPTLVEELPAKTPVSTITVQTEDIVMLLELVQRLKEIDGERIDVEKQISRITERLQSQAIPSN